MGKTLLIGIKEIYSGRGTEAVADASANVFTIRDGAILVEDGKISAVGPRTELARFNGPDVEVVDMDNRVAIPCFVDPHTHLVFGGERSAEFNRRLHGESYQDIAAAGGGIKYTVKQTRESSHEALYAKAENTLNDMLLHGVGTIEAKSGYGLSFDAEIKQLDVMDDLSHKHPIDITQTFMGAHEVPPEYAGRPTDYIHYLNREMLPVVAARGTVSYVDIFCEKGVFELEDTRLHMEAAREHGFGLRLHVDELFPLGGAGLAAELGAKSGDHLIHATRADMKKMAEAGTMATLLPGTSFFLRCKYADAKAFKDAGCLLALSTDFNPGSSHTISQALMMALACMNMGLTFEESFIGVTLNAAAAIEVADRVGSIEAGKQADIAFLSTPSPLDLVYYWGLNHVSDVMKSGRFVVRDKTLTI